jgi:hypothetical protein
MSGTPQLHHNPYNRYGKTHNSLARAFIEDTPSAENRALLADIQRIETDLSDKRKWQDYTNVEKDELAERMLHECSMSHWQRNTERKEKLTAEFDAFRASWERTNKRDGSERLANMARYKTEIKLDPKKAEADLYAAADASTPEDRAQYDSDYLYALAEHTANENKPGTLSVAKSALDNCNVSEPWLNTDKGANLATAILEVDTEYGIAKSDGGEIAVEVAELINVV